MKNNWKPKVGQKIVALYGGLNDFIHKGQVYVVNEVKQPCRCGFWVVDIGLRHDNELGCMCKTCGKAENTFVRYLLASFFAPVIEYPDRTSEIAKQFKEHPDTIDQPIKVLETQN